MRWADRSEADAHREAMSTRCGGGGGGQWPKRDNGGCGDLVAEWVGKDKRTDAGRGSGGQWVWGCLRASR